MTNQTIVTIPQETETQLKRSLERIVEEVDIIIGNRGTDPAASSSDLAAERVTLVTLDTRVTANETAIIALEASVEALEGTEQTIPTNYTQLDISYNDFDSTSWSGLNQNGYFSADGADLSNTPFVANGGTTYIMFVQSGRIGTDGVNQQINVQVIGSSLDTYVRSGLTFTEATTEGWSQL